MNMSTPPEMSEPVPEVEVVELSPAPSDEPKEPARNIEDLTLAETIGAFFRSPGKTLSAFTTVLQNSGEAELVQSAALRSPQALSDRRRASIKQSAQRLSEAERSEIQREGVVFGLRMAAFLFGLYGSGILASERTEQFGLNVGAPFLIFGFLLWIVAEIFYSAPNLQQWWRNRARQAATEQAETISYGDENAAVFGSLSGRLLMLGSALVFAVLTLSFTVGNRFRLEGFVTWMLSIGMFIGAFAPTEWGLRSAWAKIRSIRIRRGYTLYALIVIMALGAYLRLANLDSNPPEMTSDHVEKILDAQSILNGNPQVFFTNNGGREPIQFYLLALLSHVPGLRMDFFLLKFLTALEGLVTIPVMWLMGRAVIGDDEPELGNLVGLALAALVAVSYWHVMLSRLGLRIVLTTLFTGLVIIFFTRALRHNRRGDFILTGLALGFGLYAYQAMRMVPVVIIAGVVLAAIFYTIAHFIGKRAEWGLGKLIFNAAVLVGVSLVIFVPLLGFSIQHPDDFWRRTQGRLLGDDVIQTTDANGNIVQRLATIQERIDAFNANVPILLSNIRNALLMYNWKGDVAWINAVPNRPTMDTLTATLLIVGLAAWVARMIRRRDVADWLLPIMLFIMLLPSALSIAYPIENPSATRTSGSLPEAYLFAALPLALLAYGLWKVLRGRNGLIAGFGLAGVVVLLAFVMNRHTYFDDYYESYLNSSPAPYSEAGRFLEGFAQSGGSTANAFMIAYPYWWDHRAVGIEAGLLDWPNGIITRDAVPSFLYDASLRTGQYRLDPDKDLLFFYSVTDTDTEAQLHEWFPTGYSHREISYKPGDDFMTYRVPALGTDGFIDFAVRSGASQ